jgi:hypothetical protein
MKNALSTLYLKFKSFFSLESTAAKNTSGITEVTNSKIKEFKILDCMYQDSYFPEFLVDKCKAVLLQLCYNIEKTKPTNLEGLYMLTHAATEKINDLENEFHENDSEIETGARECLAENFEFIANAYGFEADIEELIEPREW